MSLTKTTVSFLGSHINILCIEIEPLAGKRSIYLDQLALYVILVPILLEDRAI